MEAMVALEDVLAAARHAGLDEEAGIVEKYIQDLQAKVVVGLHFAEIIKKEHQAKAARV